jgi:hypothetical protein
MDGLLLAGQLIPPQSHGRESATTSTRMKQQITLNVEELEERIAPDSVNGVPGESNGNPGNEVSNGHKPQPGNNTADSHGN